MLNLIKFTKSTIDQNKWLQLLIKIDLEIAAYYNRKDILILSAPYQLNQTQDAIQQSLFRFDQTLVHYCFDIIINDFLTLSTEVISNKLSDNNKSLLLTEAIIIIHIESNAIISLPRYIHQSTLKFKSHEGFIDIIKNCIIFNIKSVFSSSYQQWSNKDNFDDIFDGISGVGYLENNGNFSEGSIIGVTKNKIWVKFDSKCKWISIPNNRIFTIVRKKRKPINNWQKCLRQMHVKLMNYYHHDGIIILAAPYPLHATKYAIKQFIGTFYVDIILDYLLPNSQYVSNKLSKNCDCIYYSLLAANAIVIINIKHQNIFTIPRDIDDLNEDSFSIYFTNNDCFIDIIKCLYLEFHKIYPSKIKSNIAANWSKRCNFDGVSQISYLCENGKIIDADIIQQKEDKIFIVFQKSVKEFEHRFAWIKIPNYRIAPCAGYIYPKHQPMYILNKHSCNHEHERKNDNKITTWSNRFDGNGNCDITCCQQLKRFQLIMKSYTDSTNTDTIGIQLLENFIHLIYNHDDYNSFNIIYHRLEASCNLDQCKIFQRNYRDRSTTRSRNQLYKLFGAQDTVDIDVRDIAIKQIVDKMHCFYYHSYDIGYRLTIDCSPHDVETNIMKHVSQKRSGIYRNKYRLLTSDKFYTGSTQKQIKYSIGYIFDYPYHYDSDEFALEMQLEPNDDEHQTAATNYHSSYCRADDMRHINIHDTDWKQSLYIGRIKHKYKNLKQELTSNSVSTIAISQYNDEWEKAKIYYATNYCKKNHGNNPIFWPHNETKNKYYYYRRRWLSISDLLAVMVYCNYTELQYEFSRTYRKIKMDETKQEIK
eukprot:74030_1